MFLAFHNVSANTGNDAGMWKGCIGQHGDANLINNGTLLF